MINYREDPRYDKIVHLIEDMKPAEQVSIHNKYCDATNGLEYAIYWMDNFEELLGNSDVAELIYRGHGFSYEDDFFGFDGYGHLWSSNDPIYNGRIFAEDIARECVVRDEDFGSDEIREILDEEVTDDDDA